MAPASSSPPAIAKPVPMATTTAAMVTTGTLTATPTTLSPPPPPPVPMPVAPTAPLPPPVGRTAPTLDGAAAALLANLLGWPADPAPGTPSLYTLLRPYATAADAALDPAPPLNAGLTALVHTLQGRMHCAARLGPFAHVQRQVCAAIDASPALQDRAAVLLRVATRAEARLELFYVPVLMACGGNDDDDCDARSDGGASGHSSDSTADRSNASSSASLDAQQQQAGSGGGVAAARTVDGNNVAAAARIEAAAAAFPYIGNYISMVDREAAVLRAALPAPPRHIVFCGSGPLPLTGLLLGAHLGARVTLVDNDPAAVASSQRLLASWAARGVVDALGVRVVCADCASLRFVRRRAPEPGSKDAEVGGGHIYYNGPEDMAAGDLSPIDGFEVDCDVVFVAALIPPAAKERLARSAGRAGAGGPLVVARTAHGLTARVAYERSGRERLTSVLELIGTVVPRTHALGDGGVVDDDVRPMGMFEEEILNSLELYRWSGIE